MTAHKPEDLHIVGGHRPPLQFRITGSRDPGIERRSQTTTRRFTATALTADKKQFRLLEALPASLCNWHAECFRRGLCRKCVLHRSLRPRDRSRWLNGKCRRPVPVWSGSKYRPVAFATATRYSKKAPGRV